MFLLHGVATLDQGMSTFFLFFLHVLRKQSPLCCCIVYHVCCVVMWYKWRLSGMLHIAVLKLDLMLFQYSLYTVCEEAAPVWLKVCQRNIGQSCFVVTFGTWWQNVRRWKFQPWNSDTQLWRLQPQALCSLLKMLIFKSNLQLYKLLLSYI